MRCPGKTGSHFYCGSACPERALAHSRLHEPRQHGYGLLASATHCHTHTHSGFRISSLVPAASLRFAQERCVAWRRMLLGCAMCFVGELSPAYTLVFSSFSRSRRYVVVANEVALQLGVYRHWQNLHCTNAVGVGIARTLDACVCIHPAGGRNGTVAATIQVVATNY